MISEVEAVFNDFTGRRTAIIKALTYEFKAFHGAFKSGEDTEDLRLFGFPDGHWEVHSELVALADLPVPRTGYNFSRDNLSQKVWSFLIAADSDAWLISVAFFYGTKSGFDKADRQHLFDMISSLPTILEVLMYAYTKRVKKKSTVPRPSGNKSKSDSKKTGSEPQDKYSKPVQAKDSSKRVLEEEEKEPVQAKDRGKRVLEEEDKEPVVEAKDSGKRVLEEEDNEENSLCGQCGQKQASSNDAAASHDFWIACDECKKWYHGKCVHMSKEESKHFRYYKCPNCSKKRSRRF